ncbi:MAG: hypothetical protein H6567_04920 [Lewinellaceae bacterium]|nr:hypothetical protein [Lewinellaceae bacterium]
MIRSILTLCLILSLLDSGSSEARPCCQLGKNFHATKPHDCYSVLLDRKGLYDKQEVLSALRSDQFIPISVVPKSELRQNHWLKMDITQDFAKELVLMLKFSDLRGAWLVKNEQLLPVDYAGYFPEYDSIYHSILKVNHRCIFSLIQGDTMTFIFKTFPKYLERGDDEPIIYDLRKYEHELYTSTNVSTLLNGIVLGFMFLFLGISFLIFFLYKERAYLAYIFYLIFVITYLWRDFEYLNLFFFSTMRYVAWHETKLIMNCLIGGSYIIFIKLLLNTKTFHPKVDKILTVFLVLLIIAIPIDYIGSEWMNWWPYKVGMYYAGAVALITQIFYNTYFIRDKDPVVRYIVLGTFFLTLGAISIPIFDVSIHTWIVRVCFILEMIFFTAALSQKIKKIYKDRIRVENELKESQIRHAYETQIKLSHERQKTEENIRNEIARDIHDEIGAELTKISLATHLLSKSDMIINEGIRNKIAKIGEDATQTHKQLRQLLFSINPSYDNFKLVQTYFEEIAAYYFSDTNIKLKFANLPSETNPKMDRIVKSQLQLILKEVLHNIVKHSKAENVTVSLNLINDKSYKLVIKDDGIGIGNAPTKLFSSGLKNMEARAKKINAQFSISSLPNGGTEVIVEGYVQ